MLFNKSVVYNDIQNITIHIYYVILYQKNVVSLWDNIIGDIAYLRW